MSRLTRDGTAEPVSRDQILRHARGQGNIHFPCSADHEQDWRPYPVDPYSAICDGHTYIPIYIRCYAMLFVAFFPPLFRCKTATATATAACNLFVRFFFKRTILTSFPPKKIYRSKYFRLNYDNKMVGSFCNTQASRKLSKIFSAGAKRRWKKKRVENCRDYDGDYKEFRGTFQNVVTD